MINKPRRPWIAALLTLVTRGLGHLYSGNLRRGLILFGIDQLLLLSFAASILVITPNLIILTMILTGSLAFVGFCVVDAVLIARQGKANYELKKYNRWFAYVGYFVVLSLLFSTIVSSIIKANFVEAFKIPSGAMVPTVLIGDHLLADKFVYKTNDPKRGDIVIFPCPEDPSRTFIKRLIAVEGDVVEIRNKKLFINEREQQEEYIVNTDPHIRTDQRDNYGPLKVPPGQLFFMGDNRDQSYDSRFYGFVPKDTIKGKAVMLYWSWNYENNSVRWNRIGKQVQ